MDSHLRTVILETIKHITQGDVSLPTKQGAAVIGELCLLTLGLWEQWKVLITDENSKKIIDNVVKEDDILNQNIASMASEARAGSAGHRG